MKLIFMLPVTVADKNYLRMVTLSCSITKNYCPLTKLYIYIIGFLDTQYLSINIRIPKYVVYLVFFFSIIRIRLKNKKNLN